MLPIKNTTILRGALLAASLTIAAASHAAIINWSAAQNITNDNDVSTAGTLVAAYNVGGAGIPATTINGVTFQAFAAPNGGGAVTVGNFTLDPGPSTFGSAIGAGGSPLSPFSNLSSSYQVLLRSYADRTTNTGVALTMSGLTVGQTYQFEFWGNYSSTALPGGLTTATAGNTVNVSLQTSGVAGGTGQYAIGTFTADAGTELVEFAGPNCGLLNGFQLRALGGPGPAPGPSPIPEPGSALAGLLALGVCAGGMLRRSRIRP